MKNLFALMSLLLLLSFTLEAQAKGFRLEENESVVVEEVLGDLIVKSLNSHPEMVIRAYDRDIKLSNVHTHWKSCINGIFLVTSEQGQARLLDVIECQEIIPHDIQAFDPNVEGPVFCPEIYQPVCGLNKNAELQDVKTFSNLCKLNSEKADFLHHGECHSI